MSLKQDFKNKIIGQLKKKMKYSSDMAVPRPVKVIINVGLGEALKNPKAIEDMQKAIEVITGQRPVITKAKKDVAGFDVRKGNVVGIMVTLRGKRMWDFLDRLTKITLPRVRDFYGLSRKSFDGRGNFSLGIKEQMVFTEVDPNTIEKVRSLQVVIHTTASNDDEGYVLLKSLGFPFLD